MTTPVSAHIRLLHPPAFTSSDFLDNARTPAPCGGVPTQGAIVTSLASGTPISVFWSLAYAHYGGHTLQARRCPGSPTRNAAQLTVRCRQIVNTTLNEGAGNCGYELLANLTSGG